MNNDVKNISKLTCEVFELEVGENVYKLELDNEALMYADRINFINNVDKIGTQELAEQLIEIFGKKHNPSMNNNLAKKIVSQLFADGYDVVDLITNLADELALRFEQVFTSKGKKKALKRI